MNLEDLVVGSVWQSSYSNYVWVVVTARQHKTRVARRTVRSGQCLILYEDGTRYPAFPVGSVQEWRSELQWCQSSKRIA